MHIKHYGIAGVMERLVPYVLVYGNMCAVGWPYVYMYGMVCLVYANKVCKLGVRVYIRVLYYLILSVACLLGYL